MMLEKLSSDGCYCMQESHVYLQSMHPFSVHAMVPFLKGHSW